VTLPVPMSIVRLLTGEADRALRVDAADWSPTAFDLSLRSSRGAARIVRLAARLRMLWWMPVLAPLFRLSVSDGRLRWRPHPAGVLLGLDAFWWRLRKGKRRRAETLAPARNDLHLHGRLRLG
jgi:hypothetical protein